MFSCAEPKEVIFTVSTFLVFGSAWSRCLIWWRAFMMGRLDQQAVFDRYQTPARPGRKKPISEPSYSETAPRMR